MLWFKLVLFTQMEAMNSTNSGEAAVQFGVIYLILREKYDRFVWVRNWQNFIYRNRRETYCKPGSAGDTGW